MYILASNVNLHALPLADFENIFFFEKKPPYVLHIPVPTLPTITSLRLEAVKRQ